MSPFSKMKSEAYDILLSNKTINKRKFAKYQNFINILYFFFDISYLDGTVLMRKLDRIRDAEEDQTLDDCKSRKSNRSRRLTRSTKFRTNLSQKSQNKTISIFLL